MGDKPAGPLCLTKAGKKWVDGGTLCQARSPKPGPAGLKAGKVIEVNRRGKGQPPELSADEAMLSGAVSVLEESPFAGSQEGKQVLTLLRGLLQQKQIEFGDVEDDRGGFDGTSIIVNQEYRGNLLRTVPTLVHEATHALYRRAHPLQPGKQETLEELTENEYRSERNEVEIYVWLRDEKKWGEDSILNRRAGLGTKLRDDVRRREAQKLGMLVE